MADSHRHRPIDRVRVVCPLEFEQRAVARALRRAGLGAARVSRGGVGGPAVTRWVEQAVADLEPGAGLGAGSAIETGGRIRPELLILAGTCGALRPVADVPALARIIDGRGGEWPGGIGMAASGQTLVGVDQMVSTPAAKRELADRTGAAAVDMESHRFAAACERAQVAWSVVRGVSDGPDESLPAELIGWVDSDGRTRPGLAAWGLLRRPDLIPVVARVMRRSARVLPLVGRRVAEIIEGFTRGRTIDP